MSYPRYWFSRLILCGSSLVTSYIAAALPASSHRRSFDSDGLGGFGSITLVAVLAIAGLIDILINDNPWCKQAFPRLMRWRFIIYLGLFVSYLGLMLSNSEDGVDPVFARYALEALWSICMVFLDFEARYHILARIRLWWRHEKVAG